MESTLPLPHSLDLPTPTRMLRALGGFSALGLCAALGSQELMLDHGLEAALVPVAGAIILTTPALLVGHQYLNLRAEPRQLLHVLAQTLCQAGDLALGLVPTLGLFVLTTNITPLLFALAFSGVGSLALSLGFIRLQQVERNAGGGIGATVGMAGLALGWAILTGLIGLRLLVPPTLALF